MPQPLHVLIVEDNPTDADLLAWELRHAGYDLTWSRVETEAAMIEHLRDDLDLVISDYRLPQFGGLQALVALQKSGREIPFILVSGTIGEDIAVEAMRLGATDYLIKDRLGRLGAAVAQALETRRLRAERRLTEARLLEEQALFGSLIRTIPDLLYFKDRQSRFVRVNDAMARRFGLGSPADAIGKTDFDFFPCEHARETCDGEQCILRTGEPLIGLEEKETRPDGHVTWSSTTKVPWRNAAGDIIGTIGISRDVTSRKKVESRLAVFARLGQRLSAADDGPAAARVIAEVADELLGWDACTFDLFFERENILRSMLNVDLVAGQRTDVPPARPSTAPSPRVAQVIAGGGQLILREPGAGFAPDAIPFGDTQRPSASILVVPVRDGTHVVGMFSIQSYRPHAYTVDDLATLQALADHCGGALNRIQTADRLRQAERKYRDIFENAVEGIFQSTPDGRVLTVNPACARLFGFDSPEEMLRERAEDARGNYTDPAARERLQQLLKQQGTVANYEFEARHRDGRAFWLSMSARAVRDASGAVIRYEGSLVDITARKESERRLREQAAVLDNASEFVVVLDLENRVTFWNRGVERVLGWMASEVVGRSVEEIFALLQVADMETLRTTLAGEADWRGEVRLARRDGTPIVVSTSITVLRNEASEPIGRLTISSDITETKKLQEKFLRAQRLESLGMLATGIAHDLNNVLAPISMAVPLLRTIASSPAGLRLLDTLEKSAARGAELVQQILGFAHGIGGEARVVQVKHLLRDIVQVVAETFPKSISLEEQIPSDLWPVVGNPTQVHQVLLNLCINARDAMPDGGRLLLRGENCTLDSPAAAALEAAHPGAGVHPGEWLVLHVEDSGTGILPETLPHIWEPFFTTKGPQKGTGLGLCTVRGIVENHRGFITVQTRSGLGTVFRVHLPAAESSSGGSHVAVPAVAAGRGHGESVLLVDDEELIRETAVSILKKAGYRVTTAADGAEAAQIFAARAADFALIITDLDMPQLDGASLARAIRSTRPETKILAMSGLTSRRVTDQTAEFSDAFLAKPFSSETLLRTIQQLLAPSSSG